MIWNWEVKLLEEILPQVAARVKAIKSGEVFYPSHIDATAETKKQLHQAKIELSASSIYPQLLYTSHWHQFCTKNGKNVVKENNGTDTINLSINSLKWYFINRLSNVNQLIQSCQLYNTFCNWSIVWAINYYMSQFSGKRLNFQFRHRSVFTHADFHAYTVEKI